MQWKPDGVCAAISNSTHVDEYMGKLFMRIAFNCALRNGDAHLKNFGIVYDGILGLGEARLVPVYDLVTTSAYIAKDTPRNNSGDPVKTRGGATPANVREILERVDEATRDTASEVSA